MIHRYYFFPLILLILGATFVETGSSQAPNYGLTGGPEREGIELLQAEPYDVIRIKESAKGGGWAKVVLLPFPGRKVPTNPTGKLVVTVLGMEGKQFEINWNDIESIELWEERIEREARERIAAGDFHGAYPFLSIMMRDAGDTKAVRELRCDYLLRDAAARYQRKEWKETLAVLEELRRFAPEYRTAVVLEKISEITDTLMDTMLEQGQLENAQQLLARLTQDYSARELATIGRWNERFLTMANEKKQAAIQAKEREDYRSARQLARDSLHIYPDVPGGRQLVKEIDTIYPLVRVGVLQTASVLDPTRIDNWAARRAGNLVFRTLFEMRGAGPEGGDFDFIFGDTEQSDDRLLFELQLDPIGMESPLQDVTAYQIADALSARGQRSSPAYDPAWASAVDSIAVTSPRSVQCFLRRPHVLPASLLQILVDGSWLGEDPETPTGVYRRDVREEALTRYTLTEVNPNFPTQPREVVEVDLPNAADGVAALLRGEVDIIDRLFPADAELLRNSSRVRVGRYPLPSVHMLIPCSDHPYLSQRTFRRALIYAINRQDILQGELLGNRQIEGCGVVSGPFPAGYGDDDPLGYAYNRSVKTRPYEPRLARLLIEMNNEQMKADAERRKTELPEMAPIRLAVPADNVALIAAEAIKTQLELLQVFEVELVQLPLGESMPAEGTADLVYVSAAVWEPSIDARRILGPDGLAQSNDQMIGLGLRRLESARSWFEVRERLHDLHRTCNHELPILPLWQMVDSYAYRTDVSGVGQEITTLYQNVRRWRLAL